MKKILLIFAIAAFCGFSSTKIQAAVSSVSDLCGTYSFTATQVSVADDYSFPTTFDVTIEENVNVANGVAINGFAGATEAMYAVADFTAKTLTVSSMPAYSSSNYAIVFSNADGAYPYDYTNGYASLTFSFDDEKNLSLDAYTIVTVDHAAKSATILGSFKDAKGVAQAGADTPAEVINFAGTYKVKATRLDYTQGLPPSSSDFEYDIVIEAGSDANSYTVKSIAGYATVTMVNATAEGNELSININYNYLTSGQNFDVLGDASYEDAYSTTGGLKITYADGAYTINDYSVWGAAWSSEGTSYSRKYYFMYNTITEGPEQSGSGSDDTTEVDWVGTWKMTIDKSQCMAMDATYEYPEVSYFTIEESTDNYLIKTFMNSTDPYGGILAAPSADNTTVTISNLSYALLSAGMKCYNLADVNGQTTGTITITNNGDNTLTIGDFCVGYTDYSDNSTGLVLYIPSAAVTIEKQTSAISLVGADNSNAPVEYYNLQGVKVLNPANGIFIKKQGTRTSKVVL